MQYGNIYINSFGTSEIDIFAGRRIQFNHVLSEREIILLYAFLKSNKLNSIYTVLGGEIN